MLELLVSILAGFSIAGPVNAATHFERPLALGELPVAKSIVRPLPPKKRRPESIGIHTTSRAVFVADVATGSVLYAKKPHDVMPIASLTKLMTAIVVADAKLPPDEMITFLEEDFADEGKAVFAVGDTITRREAMKALLVGSVNAAGNALARTSLGREQFVQAMNEKAKVLKLSSPVFVDPTGLDPQNRANAADIAALMGVAMSYPDIRALAALPQQTITTTSGQPYTILSTNLLLGSFLHQRPYAIIGAKTGSLPQAGFCMAQLTRDAAGHEIVAVTLASSDHFSRYQDIKGLTAWAFDTFEWPQ